MPAKINPEARTYYLSGIFAAVKDVDSDKGQELVPAKISALLLATVTIAAASGGKKLPSERLNAMSQSLYAELVKLVNSAK